jgi:hypothetical protein
LFAIARVSQAVDAKRRNSNGPCGTEEREVFVRVCVAEEGVSIREAVMEKFCLRDNPSYGFYRDGIERMSRWPEPGNSVSLWPIGFFIAGVVFMFLSWALHDVDRTTAMAPDTVVVTR